VDLQSPIVLLKACKNPAELRGMRACHLRDAAAVVEFLASLDTHYSPHQKPQLQQGGKRDPVVPLSEVQLADKLQACRARCEGFVGPSFATIAGVNENGAIIHYRCENTRLCMRVLEAKVDHRLCLPVQGEGRELQGTDRRGHVATGLRGTVHRRHHRCVHQPHAHILHAHKLLLTSSSSSYL
jgi:hypothetical protein